MKKNNLILFVCDLLNGAHLCRQYGVYIMYVLVNMHRNKYNTEYHLHCIDKNSETLHMKLF